MVAFSRFFVPSRLLLSLSDVHNHTRGPTGCEAPFLRSTKYDAQRCLLD